jgi:hypothetical protein
MTLFFHSLGHSAWAEQMGRSFDLQWIGEAIAEYGRMPALPVLAAAVGVYLILEVGRLFLLGGALRLFCARETFTLEGFFAGCGRYFWSFVRLGLLSLVFYAVAIAAARLLAKIGQAMWGEGSVAGPLIYWGWFRLAVLLCLVGYVGLVFDYARIRMVADCPKAFRAMRWSFRFVGANFKRTAGLYIVLRAIVLLFIAVYFGLSRVVAETSVAALTLLLVFRQILVLARTWSRLLFYASQFELYDALETAPAVEPEPVEEPVSGAETGPLPEASF